MFDGSRFHHFDSPAVLSHQNVLSKEGLSLVLRPNSLRSREGPRQSRRHGTQPQPIAEVLGVNRENL